MHVGIALTMRMAHHVHWNSIDENRKVGAVIRVKSAEKNLIRLAAAVVLANDQPRREAQNIAWSI